MIKEKIMVVEDDAITAMEIKENLELWGYQVPITVKAGEDAVKEAFRIQPDLIIMNIDLQGEMDGIEAAEQIKELDIPILYLSGLMDGEIIERTRTQPT